MTKEFVLEHIKKNRVFSLIRKEEKFAPYDIARALIDGGLTTIEISMDIPNVTEVIDKLKPENILLGACSVITAQQVQLAIQAGAQFIDTPVMEMSVIKFSKGDAKVPLIVGASTANEAYESWKLNTLYTKIFPTKAMGGVDYITYMMHIMPFLRVIASSGITTDDFTDYLDAGAAAVGLGRTLYEGISTLNDITVKARAVRTKLDEYLEQEALKNS